MERKNSPNNVSLEDLLGIVNNSTEEERTKEYEPNPGDSVLGFISQYNLKRGTHPISLKFLHNLYNHWTNDSVSALTFNNVFREYFIVVSHGNTCYVMLDENGLKLKNQLAKYIEEKATRTVKRKVYQKHFESFLKRHNLRKGYFWIEGYLLYYLYDRWTYKNNNKTPLAFKAFIRFLKLYFKSEMRTKDTEWFQVDQSAMKESLSLKLIEELRMHRKQWNEKQKENRTKGKKRNKTK